MTGRPSDSSPAATLTGRAPEADALLCDPRRAWIVEEGEVALFVVQLEGGSALAWEPIGRLQRGGLLGGVAVGKRAGLVARVPADARLRGVWLDRPNGARLAEPIDRWLAYAFGVLDSRLAPGRAHPLLRSRRERSAMQLPIQMLQVGVPAQPLQDMQIAIPPGSDTWVAVRAGTVRLLGPERSRQLGTGEISPVGDAEWLLSEGDAAVSVHTTRDVVVAGTFGDGLRNLSDDLLHAVVRRLEKVEATERARQQELSARDQRTIDGVVHDFRAVLDRRIADLGGLDEGPVFVAARIVGAHLGVEIRSPGASAEHGPKSDAISKIARASRLRTRQVTLEGRWWRHDHGPLIGGLREGNLAVALIPGRRGYRLHDPVNGERRRVDAKQAARLLPTARELYPPMPARPLSARDVVRFAAAGARSDLRTMGFAALAVAVLGLLVPIMTGEILGTLVPHAERSRITELCLLLLVSALVSAMLNMVFNLAALRIEGRLDHRLQSGIWDRMLALPANFFGDYSTGELGTAVMGVSQARETLTGVSFQAGLAAVVIVADLVLIAVLDLRLLLAGLVILTIAIGVAVVAGRRQLRHQYGSYEFEKEVNSRTYQLITGVAKVATAGAQARGFAHWGSVFATMRRHTFAARAVQNRMAAFSASLTLWGAIVAFFVVGDVVTVSVSTFLIFNVAYFQVLASLQQITSTALTMIETVPSLQSLEPLMQAVPETVDQRQDAGRLSGAISLEHVTFGYSDAGRPALDDVSFSVAPGEFVAIVGPSGSGKSTLVRLLLAFESPERGTILYDDQDLGNLDPTSVRRQCGVVLQDTQLYAGDILNNIIGTGLYSYDDAWEALTMCGLDAEVSEMPMGMYTMLSDAGAGLSGGQRQRLLLARALVTRPSVLILDEATSALDNRTQQQVMESMSGFDATRIVVAHRLSTIRDADRIIVLDEGRLVQQGRYEELIDVEGVFRDLAQRQLA